VRQSWRRYVPSVEELEVRDGMVDSLNEDADSPVPNIMSDEEVVLRNFKGDRYVYRQPRDEAGVIELKKNRKRSAKPSRRTA
jgi:hypothetical protein